MIKVKGRIVTFTGKEYKWLLRRSKEFGLSPQNTFTGLLWERLMSMAREGVFKHEAKKGKGLVS